MKLKISVAVASFLSGRAKDLSAPSFVVERSTRVRPYADRP